MKKLLPILLATSLLFSACSIGNKDDLFQKKKYCSELKIQGIDEELITEKFYSPVRNSCIYKYADGSKYQGVFDALTKETLATNGLDIEKNIIIDEKIKELKGE